MKASPRTAPEWLTTSDVARLLGVSSDRVRQLARTGQLPYSQTPYGRLFDAAAVLTAHDRYQSERRSTGTRATAGCT